MASLKMSLDVWFGSVESEGRGVWGKGSLERKTSDPASQVAEETGRKGEVVKTTFILNREHGFL